MAAALLADPMTRLAKSFALMTFASDGRELVRLMRIKDFREPVAPLMAPAWSASHQDCPRLWEPNWAMPARTRSQLPPPRTDRRERSDINVPGPA